jgi:hypothetical protein
LLTNLKKYLDIFYLFILGFSSGVILLAGMTASIIFNINDFFANDLLTHYQSGIVMTAIFAKTNYIINILVLTIIIIEADNYLKFRRDYINLILAFFIVCCGLLFTQYYTPYILEMQALGEKFTQTDAFNGMHKGSEIAFKIIFVSSIVLFFRKLLKNDKNR